MAHQSTPLRILVVGCGNMGASHAVAYHSMDAFDICGLVARGKSKETLNDKLGGGYALYNDYEEALSVIKLDAVCISTYPDTHEAYNVKAFQKGCHVFIEKPLADMVAGVERVIAAGRKANKN